MKATVLVRPKPGILDPQGEAVGSALGHLGFAVRDARVGKVIDLEVEADRRGGGEGAGRADVRAAAREPADRVVRGRDRWLARSRGSASSRIPARRTTATRSGRSRALDAEAVPSGTRSATSRPRRGRAAGRVLVRRLPPLRRDRPLLAGDGRGLRVRGGRRARARDLQRLPGPLRGRPTPGRAAARTSRCASSAATCRCGRAGRPAVHLALHRRPAARRSRSSTATAATSRRPISTRRRSCSATVDNPNGSVDGIAGVCNEAGNVMGLMPHPEHAVDPLLGSDDGALSSRRSSTPRASACSPRLAPHPERLRELPDASRGRLSAVRCLALGGSPARACRRPGRCRRSERASPPSPSRAAGPSMRTASCPACCGTVSSSTRSAGPHGVAALVAMPRTLGAQA